MADGGAHRQRVRRSESGVCVRRWRSTRRRGEGR
jgi:hypothetical protein